MSRNPPRAQDCPERARQGREWINGDTGQTVGKVPKSEQPYVQFFQSVEEAIGEQVIFALVVMRKAAAKGDWRAAAWANWAPAGPSAFGPSPA